MTQNALVASHWYVITAIPDHLSTIGLSILQSKVKKIEEMMVSARTFAQDRADHAVAELGALVFVKVRIGGSVITNTHARKMDDITNSLPVHCTVLGQTTELIGYGEAAENSVPVWEHSSQNAKRAADKQEYESITDEFVRRFDTSAKGKKAAS